VSHPFPNSTFTKPRAGRMGRGKGLRSADTKARREKRERLQAARAERPPTYRQLEKKLKGLVATRVKLRDGHRCQQGLTDGVICDGVMDAGHIYPAGKFPYFKFEPDNIVCQCRQHNTLHIGRPDVMLCWYQKVHGEDALVELRARAVAATRPTRDDLLRMIEENEREIAVLKLTRVA